MKTSRYNAFTLIELLVVISIIAILAGIALPVFGAVQIKGAQTKALSNAKQIGTALRLYAVDNNGVYPSYALTDGKPISTNPVTTSNAAFAQLIPDYVPNEDIFWLSKSKWCNVAPPDNQIDKDSPDAPVKTLTAGENEWAYVLGLTDTSNPSFPILADAFAEGGDESHEYATSETVKGGVWRGKAAVIIRCDGSGTVAKVNSKSMQIEGPNGSNADGDIFTTGNAADGWLGEDNTVVQPIAP